MSETDDAIDRTLRAMTAVDEAAAARGEARVLAAIREGARPGVQPGGESGRTEAPRKPSAARRPRAGWLSGQPRPLPVSGLVGAAAAALLVAALVAGGGLWQRTRSGVPSAQPPIASAPAPAATAGLAPDAASPSPLTGSATQPAAVNAAAALPAVASRPPLDIVRGARGAREGRAGTAARDGEREGQFLAAREEERPIGDPIPALDVESIAPSLLTDPAPITTARVEADAIVIEPIRISAFDAPPTPRSH